MMVLSSLFDISFLTHRNTITELAPSNGFFFAIHDKLNDDLVEIFLGLTEQTLERKSLPKNIRKKFFFLLVESLQNVTRHGKSSSVKDFSMVKNEGETFSIGTGNSILGLDASKIKSMLTELNQCSHDELRSMYMKILGEGSFSERGGAGLGLIEIARKSGSPIRSAITNKKNNDFLFLETTVGGNEVMVKVDLETETMHNLFEEHGIKILYKGDFSEENVTFLLKILRSGDSDKYRLMDARMFAIGVEFLQNVSKHAHNSEFGTEGTFCLIKNETHYEIITSNHILETEERPLKERLDQLNKLDESGLNQLYDQVLLAEKTETDQSTGLGLIDMRLRTGQKLDYEFRPANNHKTLFVISIKIEK